MPTTLWTIGHSNRSLDEFLAMLAAFEIELLADVRRFPGSRKHPQFNQDQLTGSLAAAGIAYEYFPELGGRRKAQADSLNTAWRNASFRAYADFMETDEFRGGIDRLLSIAGPPQHSDSEKSESLTAGRRVAIMCSEAVWWRCHRSLIADYLKARGIDVYHIMSATKQELHPYTSAARIVDGQLSYREADPQARLFPS